MAELVGLGSRRAGVVVLALLAVGAVLVPVLLVTLVRSPDATRWSGVLGLALGLVVDLLVAVLLLGVVTHRMTSRQLRAHARVLRRIDGRTDGLDRKLGRTLDRSLERGLERALERQSEGLRRQAPVVPATRANVDAAATNVANRLQATQNLFALVPPHGLVPPMVGYVAAPDVLVVLVQKFLTLRPSLVVECGSGTSTLFLALAAQQHGIDCRLVSLEHELLFAEGTRALLAEHGVAHLADVRHAPLTPTNLPDHEGPWYAPAAYEDLHDIGLVFVDGPPGDVGPQARYPMVPLLGDRLADACVIVLDDAVRQDERGVAERWTTQLEGFSYTYLPLIRGAGLFQRGL